MGLAKTATQLTGLSYAGLLWPQIRVIDRFNVNGPTPEMAAVTLTFFVVISFKAGFVRGKHVIRIVPLSPAHEDMPAIDMPQFFEGDDDRGVVIASQMNFVVKEEGLYWFRIYFENALVTQMPLRVVYQQVGSAGPAAG